MAGNQENNIPNARENSETMNQTPITPAPIDSEPLEYEEVVEDSIDVTPNSDNTIVEIMARNPALQRQFDNNAINLNDVYNQMRAGLQQLNPNFAQNSSSQVLTDLGVKSVSNSQEYNASMREMTYIEPLQDIYDGRVVEEPSTTNFATFKKDELKAFLQIAAAEHQNQPITLFPDYNSVKNDSLYRDTLGRIANFNTDTGIYTLSAEKMVAASQDQANPLSLKNSMAFVFDENLTTAPQSKRYFSMDDKALAKKDYEVRLDFEYNAKRFADVVMGREPTQVGIYLQNPLVAKESHPNPFLAARENPYLRVNAASLPAVKASEIKNPDYKPNHKPVLIFPDAKRYSEDMDYRNNIAQIADPIKIKGIRAFAIKPENLTQLDDNGNVILKKGTNEPQLFLNYKLKNLNGDGFQSKTKAEFILENNMDAVPNLVQMRENGVIFDNFFALEEGFMKERNNELARKIDVDSMVKPMQTAYKPASVKIDFNQSNEIRNRLESKVKAGSALTEKENADWQQHLDFFRTRQVMKWHPNNDPKSKSNGRFRFVENIDKLMHQDFPGLYATGGTIAEFIKEHKLDQYQGENKRTFANKPNLPKYEDVASKIGYDVILDYALGNNTGVSEYLGEVKKLEGVKTSKGFYGGQAYGSEGNGGVAVSESGWVSVYSHSKGTYTFSEGRGAELSPLVKRVYTDYYNGNYSAIKQYLDPKEYNQWVKGVEDGTIEAATTAPIQQISAEEVAKSEAERQALEEQRAKENAAQIFTVDTNRKIMVRAVNEVFDNAQDNKITTEMLADSDYLTNQKGIVNLENVGPDLTIIKKGANAKQLTLWQYTGNQKERVDTFEGNPYIKKYNEIKTVNKVKQKEATIKFKNNDVLVKMYQINDQGEATVVGAQSISDNAKRNSYGKLEKRASKNYVKHTVIDGTFTILNGKGTQDTIHELTEGVVPPTRHVFGEGVATTLSVLEMAAEYDKEGNKNEPIGIFFGDVGNEKDVLNQFVGRYGNQGHEFIIAADNDYNREKVEGYTHNAGKYNAVKNVLALREQYGNDINVTIALPDFEAAKKAADDELTVYVERLNDIIKTETGVENGISHLMGSNSNSIDPRRVAKSKIFTNRETGHERSAFEMLANAIGEAQRKSNTGAILKGSDFNDLHQNIVNHSVGYIYKTAQLEEYVNSISIEPKHADERINDMLVNNERQQILKKEKAQMVADDLREGKGLLSEISKPYFSNDEQAKQQRMEKTNALVAEYSQILEVEKGLIATGMSQGRSIEMAALVVKGAVDVEKTQQSLVAEYESKAARPLSESRVARVTADYDLENNQHYGRLMLDVQSITKEADGHYYVNGIVNNSNISVDKGYQPKTASIRLSDADELRSIGYDENKIVALEKENSGKRIEQLIGKRTDAQGATNLGNSQLVLAFSEVKLEEIDVLRKPNADEHIFQKDKKINFFNAEGVHLKGSASRYMDIVNTDVNQPANPRTLANNSLATLTFINKDRSNRYGYSAKPYVQLEELYGVKDITDMRDDPVARQQGFEFLVEALNNQTPDGNTRFAGVTIDRYSQGTNTSSGSHIYIRSDVVNSEILVPVEKGGFIQASTTRPLNGLDTLYNIVVREDRRTSVAEDKLSRTDFENISASDHQIVRGHYLNTKQMDKVREYLYDTGIADLVIAEKEKELMLPPGSLPPAREYQEKTNGFAMQFNDFFIEQLDEMEMEEAATFQSQVGELPPTRMIATTVHRLGSKLNGNIANLLQEEHEKYGYSQAKNSKILSMVNNGIFSNVAFSTEPRPEGQAPIVANFAFNETITNEGLTPQQDGYVWKVDQSTEKLSQVLANQNTRAAFIQVEGSPERAPWVTSRSMLTEYATPNANGVKFENENAIFRFIPKTDNNQNFTHSPIRPIMELPTEPLPAVSEYNKFYPGDVLENAERKLKTHAILGEDADVLVDILAKKMLQDKPLLDVVTAIHNQQKTKAENLPPALSTRTENLIDITGSALAKTHEIDNIFISNGHRQVGPIGTRFKLIEGMREKEDVPILFVANLLNNEDLQAVTEYATNQKVGFKEKVQDIIALRETTFRPAMNVKPNGFTDDKIITIGSGLTDENNKAWVNGFDFNASIAPVEPASPAQTEPQPVAPSQPTVEPIATPVVANTSVIDEPSKPNILQEQDAMTSIADNDLTDVEVNEPVNRKMYAHLLANGDVQSLGRTEALSFYLEKNGFNVEYGDDEVYWFREIEGLDSVKLTFDSQNDSYNLTASDSNQSNIVDVKFDKEQIYFANLETLHDTFTNAGIDGLNQPSDDDFSRHLLKKAEEQNPTYESQRFGPEQNRLDYEFRPGELLNYYLEENGLEEKSVINNVLLIGFDENDRAVWQDFGQDVPSKVWVTPDEENVNVFAKVGDKFTVSIYDDKVSLVQSTDIPLEKLLNADLDTIHQTFTQAGVEGLTTGTNRAYNNHVTKMAAYDAAMKPLEEVGNDGLGLNSLFDKAQTPIIQDNIDPGYLVAVYLQENGLEFVDRASNDVLVSHHRRNSDEMPQITNFTFEDDSIQGAWHTSRFDDRDTVVIGEGQDKFIVVTYDKNNEVSQTNEINKSDILNADMETIHQAFKGAGLPDARMVYNDNINYHIAQEIYQEVKEAKSLEITLEKANENSLSNDDVTLNSTTPAVDYHKEQIPYDFVPGEMVHFYLTENKFNAHPSNNEPNTDEKWTKDFANGDSIDVIHSQGDYVIEAKNANGDVTGTRKTHDSELAYSDLATVHYHFNKQVNDELGLNAVSLPSVYALNHYIANSLDMSDWVQERYAEEEAKASIQAENDNDTSLNSTQEAVSEANEPASPVAEVNDYEFAPGEMVKLYLEYNEVFESDFNPSEFISPDAYFEERGSTIVSHDDTVYTLTKINPDYTLGFMVEIPENKLLNADVKTVHEVFNEAGFNGYMPNENVINQYVAEQNELLSLAQEQANAVEEDVTLDDNTPVVEQSSAPADVAQRLPAANTPAQPSQQADLGLNDGLQNTVQDKPGFIPQSMGEDIIGRRTNKLTIISSELFAEKGITAWKPKDIEKMPETTSEERFAKAAAFVLRESLPDKPRSTGRKANVRELAEWSENAAAHYNLFTQLYNGIDDINNNAELTPEQRKVQIYSTATTVLLQDSVPRLMNSMDDYGKYLGNLSTGSSKGVASIAPTFENMIKARILQELPFEQWKDITVASMTVRKDTIEPGQLNLQLDNEFVKSKTDASWLSNKDFQNGFHSANYVDEKIIVSNQKSLYSDSYNVSDMIGMNSGSFKNLLLSANDKNYREHLTEQSHQALSDKGIDIKNTSLSELFVSHTVKNIALGYFSDSEIKNRYINALDVNSPLNTQLAEKYPLSTDPEFVDVRFAIYTNSHDYVSKDGKMQIVTLKEDLPGQEPHYLYDLRGGLSRKDTNTFDKTASVMKFFTLEDLRKLDEQRLNDGKRTLFADADKTKIIRSVAQNEAMSLVDGMGVGVIDYGPNKLDARENVLKLFEEKALPEIRQQQQAQKSTKNNDFTRLRESDIRGQAGVDYTRVNPYAEEYDIQTVDMIDRYGLKGVKFGNASYIKPKERVDILKNFATALDDLSAITDLPKNAWGMGGEAGITFGVHGGGGRAAAFYDPHRKEEFADGEMRLAGGYINFTKGNGASAVAHELAHQMDNAFADKDDIRGNPTFVSRQSDSKIDTLNMRDEMKDAYKEINAFLRESGMAERSKGLDKSEKRDKPYWADPAELFARGFEAYVKAKGEQKGIQNDFLVNFRSQEEFSALSGFPAEKYPYPTRSETHDLVKAYDKFISTFEQKTVEKTISVQLTDDANGPKEDKTFEATALFSRMGEYALAQYAKQNATPAPAFMTPAEKGVVAAQVITADSQKKMVYDSLSQRFGTENVQNLLGRGLLDIVTKEDAVNQGIVNSIDQLNQVEGYYKDGKSVLVADNLTKDTTVATFLHELGGHHGFQKMMTPQAYDDVMQNVHKLIDSGNPIAVKAQQLAARESTPERQELELLPYLLTVYETEQASQSKSEVQKLVDKTTSEMKVFMRYNYGFDAALTPQDLSVMATGAIESMAQAAKDLSQMPEQQRLSMAASPTGNLVPSIKADDPVMNMSPNRAYQVVESELRQANDPRLSSTNVSGRTVHYNFTQFMVEDFAPAKRGDDINTVKNPDIYYMLQNGGTLAESQAKIQALLDNTPAPSAEPAVQAPSIPVEPVAPEQPNAEQLAEPTLATPTVQSEPVVKQEPVEPIASTSQEPVTPAPVVAENEDVQSNGNLANYEFGPTELIDLYLEAGDYEKVNDTQWVKTYDDIKSVIEYDDDDQTFSNSLYDLDGKSLEFQTMSASTVVGQQIIDTLFEEFSNIKVSHYVADEDINAYIQSKLEERAEADNEAQLQTLQETTAVVGTLTEITLENGSITQLKPYQALDFYLNDNGIIPQGNYNASQQHWMNASYGDVNTDVNLDGDKLTFIQVDANNTNITAHTFESEQFKFASPESIHEVLTQAGGQDLTMPDDNYSLATFIVDREEAEQRANIEPQQSVSAEQEPIKAYEFAPMELAYLYLAENNYHFGNEEDGLFYKTNDIIVGYNQANDVLWHRVTDNNEVIQSSQMSASMVSDKDIATIHEEFSKIGLVDVQLPSNAVINRYIDEQVEAKQRQALNNEQDAVNEQELQASTVTPVEPSAQPEPQSTTATVEPTAVAPVFNAEDAYIKVSNTNLEVGNSTFKAYNANALGGFKNKDGIETIADLIVTYAGQSDEAIQVIDNALERSFAVDNNELAQNSLKEFQIRMLAHRENTEGSNPTIEQSGLNEKYTNMLLSNIVQKAASNGKDDNGVKAIIALNEVFAERTPNLTLEAAQNALQDKVILETEFNKDAVKETSRKLRAGEALDDKEVDMVVDVMVAQYQDFPQATERLFYGVNKVHEAYAEQTTDQADLHLNAEAQQHIAVLQKGLFNIATKDDDTLTTRELVNSQARHEMVASVLTAAMNNEQTDNLADKTEYLSSLDKLNPLAKVPQEPSNPFELKDYRNIVTMERQIASSDNTAIYSPEQQRQAMNNIEKINEAVIVRFAQLEQDKALNQEASVQENVQDAVQVQSPVTPAQTMQDVEEQPAVQSPAEVFSKESRDVGQGGVFDINVQDYMKAYLADDKAKITRLKPQVDYFHGGDAQKIANEFIDTAAYDKSTGDHLRRALVDSGIKEGVSLTVRPQAEGLTANKDFAEVAVIATATVVKMAQDKHFEQLNSQRIGDADLIAENLVNESLRRREVGYQVHGKTGSLQAFEPIMVAAAKEIEVTNKPLDLKFDVEPKFEKTPSIDNNNATVYNDTLAQRQAKTLLAAVTISTADMNDEKRLAEKLHTRDIVESSLKAIGTQDALQFVKLMKSSNPTSDNYKDLGISGNAVNSKQTQVEAFGLIKGMLNESAGEVEPKVERIYNHATRYGSWTKDTDIDTKQRVEMKQVMQKAPAIEIDGDFSFLGQANKLMEDISSEKVSNRYVSSKLVGEYKPVVSPKSQERAFEATLNELKTGMIEVNPAILEQAVKIRASNDNDFAKTTKLLSDLSINTPARDLGKLIEETTRKTDEPVKEKPQNWETIKTLSDMAVVKVVSLNDNLNSYQRHKGFESVATVASKISQDNGVNQQLERMQQASRDLLQTQQRQSNNDAAIKQVVQPKEPTYDSRQNNDSGFSM